MDKPLSMLTQNNRGEWVPAIPLPFTRVFPPQLQCQHNSEKSFTPDCHRRFWTRAGYRGHYALVHILGLD